VVEIGSAPASVDSTKSEPTAVTAAVASEVVKPLSELFKKPEGTWTCSGCYMDNNKDSLKCPSCETMKPGVDPSTIPSESKIAETPQFSFGFTPTSGNLGFGDLIKSGTGGFAFGSATTAGASSLFSSPVLPIFGQKPPTTIGSSTNNSNSDNSTVPASVGGNHEDGEDDFVPTAEFTPVIPLPPLVEIRKGDENENTIFEMRAKLLRLHEGKEWKERGIGNIKILQHKEHPTKVRIVMWREQIHKLACNHYVTKDTHVTFFNNSDKSVMWSAMDFAEGEPQNEIFVCKFGKPEQVRFFYNEIKLDLP